MKILILKDQHNHTKWRCGLGYVAKFPRTRNYDYRQRAVMTSEAVVASFVRAVDQHHVLENSSEGIAEHAVASSDLSSQNKHRQLVEKMIKSLDGEIQEVAVSAPFFCQLTDQIGGAG